MKSKFHLEWREKEMLITHDYSYVNNELINLGYAALDVHSLNFDRYYTEAEMDENRIVSAGLSTEERSEMCESVGRTICERMELMMRKLNSRYDICQYNKDIQYGKHDLHFYSNRGWNGKEWYDHIQLSLNEKRCAYENEMLLAEILNIVGDLELQNVKCRVQYQSKVDNTKLHDDSLKVCGKVEGKFITYKGSLGKIKCIGEECGKKQYGFFKKGARSNYYSIDDIYVVTELIV